VALSLHFDRLWHVGVIDASIQRLLEPGFRPDIRWLPRPAFAEFWADPFAVQEGEDLCLFVEAYDYRARRGRILSTRLSRGAWSAPVEAFAPEHHVSYPFLYREGQQLVCVPEQCQAGRLCLYEVDLARGTLGRELARILDFAGVDPVLFFDGAHYWILATENRPERSGALFAFYADTLAGPYRAHAHNPLRVGPRWVRNAGTPFLHEGALYRPTQDSRLRYGHAVDLTRITVLTPDRFEQEHVTRVEPWDADYRLGVHTLSASGSCTLVDGLRPSWVPASVRAWSLPNALAMR
jgi:hypothetical protein